MGQAATTKVVNRTSGKKIAGKKAPAKKGQAKPRTGKRSADVAADAKPKKGKNVKAAPTKPAGPPRGQGKHGFRRPDAWCAILDNLEIGKTYTRAHLDDQMVKQYGGAGARANHAWWVGIYLQLGLAFGQFAKAETDEGGFLYIGLGGLPAPDEVPHA